MAETASETLGPYKTERLLSSGAQTQVWLAKGPQGPVALKIARIPEQIRGFGHVKAASLERARQAEAELLARFEERRLFEPLTPSAHAVAAE